MSQSHAAPQSSDATTPASLRALLANIIDYAGLFPPSALPLPDVVRNYNEYRASDESCMLARLIVPTTKLDDFETETADLLPTSDDAEPWRISALIKSAAVDDLAPALERIAKFNALHGNAAHGLAVVETVELKVDDAAQIDTALDAMPDELYPFVEIPTASDPRGMITALTGSEAGAKIRTGGATPELYPTPDQVARFVIACANTNVPFKATAGLHHPLRHRNDAVPADEFGFLNMFIGAAMTAVHDLDANTLTALLTETSIEAFTFTDDRITWQDHELTTSAIDDLRTTFAISFGSCSFDEPRDDLRELKLLAASS